MKMQRENQCRNFSPNIFNKNKCQNCFRPRETHLLSDKDLNKAVPIYCGWLLLAPIGTDFDNPTHRNRKWQRRYFVLFEHGALRYALDDNANTLAQGTINMNQCSDVVHSEVITGQKYSIGIYTTDMKYFIRSENRESSNAWFDQLIVFPETAKKDAQRKKRAGKRYTRPTIDYTIDQDKSTPPDIHDNLRSPKLENTDQPKSEPTMVLSSPEAVSENKNFLNVDVKRGRSISRKSTDMKQGTQTSDKPLRRAKSLDRESIAVAMEALNQRKGWLMMKQKDTIKETFSKHWFVLIDNTLCFYKDPSSEDAFSKAEGEINLTEVERMGEVELNRNYGFSIQTHDEEMLLAAVTSGIRRNWMNSIQKCLKSTAVIEKIIPEAQKSPPPYISGTTADDVTTVEIKRQRRARIRDRRKTGRSRTYDFAELRSAVHNSNDIVLEPEVDGVNLTDFAIKHEEKKDRKHQAKQAETNHENEKVEREKFPVVTSPKLTTSRTNDLDVKETVSVKSPHFILPRSAAGEWTKIENFDNFLTSTTKQFSPTKDSSSYSALNGLKDEVDSIEKHLEKSQKESLEIFDNTSLESLKGVGNSISDVMGENNVKQDLSSYHNEGDLDKVKALEIAYKGAMDENKRLKDEIHQGLQTRQQESEKLNAKIRDLKMELTKSEKRSKTQRSNLKSETSGSFKARVSELEAEMEDTGQMLAARLSALENPRRRETDESDEAGSNSSCSSINQMMKQNKEDEKIEVLTSKLRKKEGDLDSTHQRLEEVIKALKEARKAAQSSTDVHETLQANRTTITNLKKKIAEDEKKWFSVRQCLHELRVKIAEVRSNKFVKEPLNILPFLESVLEDTLQTIDGGSIQINYNNSQVNQNQSSETAASRDQNEKEIEKMTLDKLKLLTDQLKITSADVNDNLSSSANDTTILPTTSHQSKSALSSSILSNSHNSQDNLPHDNSVFSNQTANLLAEQLSLQAMVVAEMASSLERYEASTSPTATLHSDAKGVFPQTLTPGAESELLKHAGVLAEKLLLESHFVRELADFQIKETTRKSSPTTNDSESSTSSSRKRQQETKHRNFNVEGAGDLSLVQAQIHYVLHVYNDRISRLTQDVKEAQHRADMLQQKLHELVHACKTRDIELVSELAVEVDTKMSLAQTVDDLPLWRQQVDYGMLHGAEASFSTLDLHVEADFFTKLAKDVSSMSSDVSNLTNIGTRILELDASLSKMLKPSEIGEHASVIAYEAISQAQLMFLCKRIHNDYEAQISKMRSVVKQQTEHCQTLQGKLMEIENGDATRMQEMASEHKQKVERLMQQLSMVEKARIEMTSDMDKKLLNLAQKQQREMERNEARHKQETEKLRKELKDNKSHLQQTVQEYIEEIEQLKNSLKQIKEYHERQIADTKTSYEESLSSVKKEYKIKIDDINKDNEDKMDKIKDEFNEEFELTVESYKKKISELDKQKVREIEKLKEKHEKEIEDLKEDKEKAVNNITQKLKEMMKMKNELEESKQRERTMSESKHDEQMSELQEMFERSVTDIKDNHQKQLDELAEQYQQNLKVIEEEKAQEMEDEITSTKMAIVSMEKHYQEELEKLKSTTVDRSAKEETDDLKRQIETLSDLYTKKCVEFGLKEKENGDIEERLNTAEENNRVLKEQNDHLSTNFQKEIMEVKKSAKHSSGSGADDGVYQLQVELSMKKLQIAVLQQQMESFKQQASVALQGRKYHRSRRLTADGGIGLPSGKGYDIVKSKSHPDFISFEDLPSSKPVKRSSERRSYSKLGREGVSS
ncbi:uncharacterized protein LOC120332174 [Styela clava]